MAVIRYSGENLAPRGRVIAGPGPFGSMAGAGACVSQGQSSKTRDRRLPAGICCNGDPDRALDRRHRLRRRHSVVDRIAETINLSTAHSRIGGGGSSSAHRGVCVHGLAAIGF